MRRKNSFLQIFGRFTPPHTHLSPTFIYYVLLECRKILDENTLFGICEEFPSQFMISP